VAARGGVLRVLKTPCQVSQAWNRNSIDPQPALSQFDAIWDTGATGVAITQAVVDACGLAQTGMATVEHVEGSSQQETYLVNIELPNRVTFQGVSVTKAKIPAGANVLIGMEIINRGDFAVTNLNGITKFTFRIPSKANIDFVVEDTKPQGSRAERRRAARGKR